MRLAGALVVLLAMASRAAAQAPEPPGPWVIDVRGVTSGLPADTTFFPSIPSDTQVPSRGFGFGLGGHAYVLTLGPARVGAGVDYARVRGTTVGITSTVSTLAPQVSFNFGTRNGWSYLAAGLGRAWVRTTVDRPERTATADSGGRSSVNFGGGARWFLTRRVGVGFDVRWHRVAGAPRTTLMSFAVGFSVH